MSDNSLIYLHNTNVCIMYLKGRVPKIKNRIDNLEALLNCGLFCGESRIILWLYDS